MREDIQNYFDIERIIELDFLRATEVGALNSISWLGRGEKEKADAAACDAIRGMFDLVNICGEVVIGEGIKDGAPGIFKGEQLGTWAPQSVKFDIALDPIDGTTNVSKGLPNSISCIAAASPEPNVDNALQDIPSYYMMKLAYGPKVVGYLERLGVETVRLRNPMSENLPTIAKALGKKVSDLSVVVLDRPRHEKLIAEIRECGAKLRMISDGDITAAMAPSIPGSGVDVYVGIGGSPEAVLSAAGVRCLRGGLQARIWPRDEEEKKSLIAQGWGDRLNKVYRANELARGPNVIFCATGISDSPLLKGASVEGGQVITHSVLMRAKSKTVRFITAHHDLNHKTIRLRSSKSEHKL